YVYTLPANPPGIRSHVYFQSGILCIFGLGNQDLYANDYSAKLPICFCGWSDGSGTDKDSSGFVRIPQKPLCDFHFGTAFALFCPDCFLCPASCRRCQFRAVHLCVFSGHQPASAATGTAGIKNREKEIYDFLFPFHIYEKTFYFQSFIMAITCSS